MTSTGKTRQLRSAWLFAVACGTLTASCSGSGILPPAEVVTVTLASGDKLSGMYPATLTVFTDRSWTFTMFASDASASWSLVASLTEAQANAGTLNIPVMMGPIPGVGAASIRGMSGESASSGTLTLERSKGLMQGAVDVDDPSLSATFAGNYAVSCWIPRSTVDDAGVSSSGGDGDPDIEDISLSTSGCSGYRALLQ